MIALTCFMQPSIHAILCDFFFLTAFTMKTDTGGRSQYVDWQANVDIGLRTQNCSALNI